MNYYNFIFMLNLICTYVHGCSMLNCDIIKIVENNLTWIPGTYSYDVQYNKNWKYWLIKYLSCSHYRAQRPAKKSSTYTTDTDPTDKVVLPAVLIALIGASTKVFAHIIAGKSNFDWFKVIIVGSVNCFR